MGTSLTSTVTDADLDRHVAELILKEAKRKAERYKEHGVHAFVTNRDSYVLSNFPKHLLELLLTYGVGIETPRPLGRINAS